MEHEQLFALLAALSIALLPEALPWLCLAQRFDGSLCAMIHGSCRLLIGAAEALSGAKHALVIKL